MYNGNIILLGAPGSGKGTLGSVLSEELSYTIISTGDILRKEKESKSEIGNKINDLIGKGNLVPDDMINKIVEKKIKSLDKYILDGYPRTVPQAKFLENIDEVGLCIYLEISDETIIKRVTESGKTSGREDDQNIDIINKRIKQFKEETTPLIKFYKDRKMLSSIDGELSKNDVFKQVLDILSLWK